VLLEASRATRSCNCDVPFSSLTDSGIGILGHSGEPSPASNCWPYSRVVSVPRRLLLILTSNLLDFALCSFANTPPRSSKGRLHTWYGSAAPKDLAGLGRGGLSFSRRIPATLRTDQETSQPNRGALEYWADGLEPVYLQGALARAGGGCSSPVSGFGVARAGLQTHLRSDVYASSGSTEPDPEKCDGSVLPAHVATAAVRKGGPRASDK